MKILSLLLVTLFTFHLHADQDFSIVEQNGVDVVCEIKGTLRGLNTYVTTIRFGTQSVDLRVEPIERVPGKFFYKLHYVRSEGTVAKRTVKTQIFAELDQAVVLGGLNSEKVTFKVTNSGE